MRILMRPGPDSRHGYLYVTGRRIPCILGKNGITENKHEGDGTTPVGRFPLRVLLYRRGRLPVGVRFPARCIRVGDGWCDDSQHSDYNRLVRLPHSGHHESLWRSDRLYDLVFVIGYNDAPPQSRKGSAIFIHAARMYQPFGKRYTQGCIAIARSALYWLATKMRRGAWIEIKPDA